MRKKNLPRCYLCPQALYKGETFEWNGHEFCSKECEEKTKKVIRDYINSRLSYDELK